MKNDCNEKEVSLCGDKNVLILVIVVMVAHSCGDAKNY